MLHGLRALTNQINWVGNWPLWGAVRWSDISVLELDRTALVLSRILALGMAVFLVVLTLALLPPPRVGPDPCRPPAEPADTRPRDARKVPWMVLPLFAGIWLALDVSWGYEGGAAKKQEKDYWRKNMATYRDARIPDPKHVELNLDLFPERSRYHVTGKYDLINASDEPLDEILLTGGPHWEKLSWTMDDKPFTPKNSAGLFVFTPPKGPSLPARRCGSVSSTRGHILEESARRGAGKRSLSCRRPWC